MTTAPDYSKRTMRDYVIADSGMMATMDRLIQEAYLAGFCSGMDHTIKSSVKLDLSIPEEMRPL